MTTLDKILESGIFAQTSLDSISSTMSSFQEQLTARRFAKEINAGRLSIEEAYRHFWSYEENPDLWSLSKGEKWRVLLHDWIPILKIMAPILNKDRICEIIEVTCRRYLESEGEILRTGYNIYHEDLELGILLNHRFPHVHPAIDAKFPIGGYFEKYGYVPSSLPEQSDEERAAKFRDRSKSIEERKSALDFAKIGPRSESHVSKEEMAEFYMEIRIADPDSAVIKAELLEKMLNYDVITAQQFAEEYLSISEDLAHNLRFEDLLPARFPGPYGSKSEEAKAYLGKRIIGLLDSSHNDMKIFYMLSLSKLHYTNAGVKLIKCMHDQSEAAVGGVPMQVNEIAVYALGEMDYFNASPFIYRRLKTSLDEGTHDLSQASETIYKDNPFNTDPTGSFTHQCIRALGKLRWYAIQEFSMLLEQGDELVKDSAIFALNRLEDAQGDAVLLRFMRKMTDSDLECKYPSLTLALERLADCYMLQRAYFKRMTRYGEQNMQDLSAFCISEFHERIKPKGFLSPEYSIEAA